MRTRSLLLSIVLMLAVLATACESAAAKPTAEPPTPTPVPTVTPEAEDTGANLNIREALADPTVLECLSEQIGASFDPESGAIGPELLGRLGGGEFELLAECGVDVSEGFGFATDASVFDDPAVLECLASELGEDIDIRMLQRALFSGGLSEELTLAFDACGVEQVDRLAGDDVFGGRGEPGGPGGRLFGGGSFVDPEVQACLTEQLGEDFAEGFGGEANEEFTAALEACGINFGDSGGGGMFRFGGDGGFGDSDSGIFGGGRRGDGGRGGFGVDGAILECLTNELGSDALLQLRNPEGPPSDEILAVLEKCGGVIAVPVEPDGGIGDGAGPIPVEPLAEPTATPIPTSDLSIEQLTCLAGALEPAALASVVIATSSGDLSGLTDEATAALATCGVES